jgi:hypothetical protein
MNIKITTTYQIVSPESAEIGDVEEQGWYDEEGETFETPQEAVEFLTDNYAVHPSDYPSNSAKSWSTEGDPDFITGNQKYYAFHINTDDETLSEINALMVKEL